MKVVIINPDKGGSDSGNINGSLIEKNFNLEVSQAISNYLTEKGIKNFLLRNDDSTLTTKDRLNLISNLINEGDNVILLTNMLSSGNDSGAEIIYALRNTDNLATQIANNIKETGQNVLKYYQLRNPSNTAIDYYEIIREPKTTESLIVSYGYPSNSLDNSFLTNNINNLANAVGEAIYNYLEKENIYIVKPGDTLFQIANKFGITVNDLKDTNNLTTNSLTIGQELIIPEKQEETKSDYINYTVKSGDSLYKIANNYNTTVNAIIEVNNLKNNILQIGQVLKIPTDNQNNTDNNTNNYLNYTVKSGDSLYKIANNYNTMVNEIINLNNLKSNILQIGQVLKIPTNNQNNTDNNTNNYLNYTVKSGDSLYKIANNYNTSVNEIINLNNLKSNILQIGQVLKIPLS